VSLRTEIVCDPARFAAVGPAWQELWKRCGGGIFQSHDWIDSWVAATADRREIKLQVALAWDGETLRGVLPCAIYRRSGLRLLSWAAQLFSDYCDCLVDPCVDIAAVIMEMWDCQRRAAGFDLISLQQVRPDAVCRPFLEHMVLERGQLRYGERTERCMRVENRFKDGEAFFRSLNKKGRNNHTRGKRILGELGGEVTFHVVDPDEDGDRLIDDVLQLKQAWLRANETSSPLLGPDAEVLRAILARAWRAGMARIYLLQCGGKTAAASVNFVYGNRMEAYFTAYDAAYERASPGTILIVDYVRWACDRGFTHVDFLRGEEAFKFRLANGETVLSSFAGARTLMGQLAVTGHRWLSRRRQRQDTATAHSDDELAAVS
jgi:CelD/BcsL family acetyltransferase involved in cellulose biosynthesis